MFGAETDMNDANDENDTRDPVDWQLEAAAYDDDDIGVANLSHVAPDASTDDATSRRRIVVAIAEIRANDRDLLSLLFRADCPDAHHLQRYASDELPASLGREVERHLADCPLCRAELIRLNTPVFDELREVSLGEQLEKTRVFIANLVRSTSGLSLSPVRGDQDASRGGAYTYIIDERSWKVQLHWFEVPDAGYTLSGYLLTDLPALHVAVYLVFNDNLIGDTILNKPERFEFRELDAGVYSLWLDLEADQIEVPDIVIGVASGKDDPPIRSEPSS